MAIKLSKLVGRSPSSTWYLRFTPVLAQNLSNEALKQWMHIDILHKHALTVRELDEAQLCQAAEVQVHLGVH